MYDPPCAFPKRTFRRLLHAGLAGASLAAASLIAGCTSTPAAPQSMRDPQANFTAYETFALTTGAGADQAAPSVSLVEGYIRNAITGEMKRKGYVEAAAGATPDVRVEYEAAKAEKLKNNPFRIGVGVGSYGSNVGGSVGVASPSVKNVTEGTLVVHVIESARNAEVWRGTASRELGKGNIEQAQVDAVVVELLADLPARTSPP
jgi:hypothetical protein